MRLAGPVTSASIVSLALVASTGTAHAGSAEASTSPTQRSHLSWGRPDGHVALAGGLLTLANIGVAGVCLASNSSCAWNGLPLVGSFVAYAQERDPGVRTMLAVDGAIRLVMPALFVLTMLHMPDAHASAEIAPRARMRPRVGFAPLAARHTGGLALTVVNF